MLNNEKEGNTKLTIKLRRSKSYNTVFN